MGRNDRPTIFEANKLSYRSSNWHKFLLWFHSGVAQHDIALMFLSTPIKLNSAVQPVSLPTQGQKQTGQAVLSGWGSTSKSIFPSMPNVLQKAVVPILDNADCYKQLTSQPISGQKPELFDTQVCSGIAGKEVSACSVSVSRYYFLITRRVRLRRFSVNFCWSENGIVFDFLKIESEWSQWYEGWR